MNSERGLAIGVILAGALVLGACEQQMNMLKARQAFKDANTAYGVKDYGKAIASYERVLELDPNGDPRVIIPTHFYTGSSHHLVYRPSRTEDLENEAHLDQAIEFYQKTLDLVTDDTPYRDQLMPYRQYALEQLAAIYRDNLDDFGKAEDAFLSLVDMGPEIPERYYGLGDLYERFHDPELMPLLDKAIEAYQKPVEIAPTDPVAYRQVASLLNKYGRFEETMEWLRRARDAQANNPEGYYLIATYFWDKVYRDPDLTREQRQDYIDQGQAELDKALEIKSDYVDALIYKNLLLREAAKIETNAARRRELTAEADRIRDIALQLKKEQEGAAAPQAQSTQPSS